MSSVKILLVEDDLFLRDIYVEILTTENFRVVSAVDGEDALEKIKQEEWNLVLMDINLPKLTGIDVLKKIKDEYPTHLPKVVIFLTNSEEARNSKKLLELGQGYLIKTELRPDQFIEKVKVYLSKK
jgi:CheY-like chemotaxis protein